MYVKSTRPNAKREVQKERSAKRDDQIARHENVPAKRADFLLFFDVAKNSEKKRFFEEFPLFWNFCMDFIGWSSEYSYCRTKSKFFALSVSDGSSWINKNTKTV